MQKCWSLPTLLLDHGEIPNGTARLEYLIDLRSYEWTCPNRPPEYKKIEGCWQVIAIKKINTQNKIKFITNENINFRDLPCRKKHREIQVDTCWIEEIWTLYRFGYIGVGGIILPLNSYFLSCKQHFGG